VGLACRARPGAAQRSMTRDVILLVERLRAPLRSAGSCPVPARRETYVGLACRARPGAAQRSMMGDMILSVGRRRAPLRSAGSCPADRTYDGLACRAFDRAMRKGF